MVLLETLRALKRAEPPGAGRWRWSHGAVMGSTIRFCEGTAEEERVSMDFEAEYGSKVQQHGLLDFELPPLLLSSSRDVYRNYAGPKGSGFHGRCDGLRRTGSRFYI